MTTMVVRSSRRRLGALCAVSLAITALVGTAGRAEAASSFGLGTATSFAVLAGSEVTNTGASVLNGDLGVSPGTALTGFDDATVNGATHSADAVALQAQEDLTAAYDAAAGLLPETPVNTELGGLTFLPGNYKSVTLGLTGSVTLDAGGNADAIFIFKTTETLITASDSSIVLAGNADPCNVFWQIGSSATLGTGTDFTGTILAHTSITATTDATVVGRLLARGGAVTLDSNDITVPNCALLPPGTTSTTASSSTSTSVDASTSSSSTPSSTSTSTSTPTSTSTSTSTPTSTSSTTPTSTSTSTPTSTTVTSTTVTSTTATSTPTSSSSTTAPTTTSTTATVPTSSTTLLAPFRPGAPTTVPDASTTTTSTSAVPGTSTTTEATVSAGPPIDSPPDITTSSLPRTGWDLGRLTLLGVIALGLGFILVSTTRERARAAR